MNAEVVLFDDLRARVDEALDAVTPLPGAIDRLYLIWDVFGRVAVSVSEELEDDPNCRNALQDLARRLHDGLGAHGYAPERSVLFVSPAGLATLEPTREIRPRVFLADRLVVGRDWWTVTDGAAPGPAMKRFTLFSVKGGVGRSTTAAVAAWHLVRRGERVLVIDLDLESPGLSAAMLDAESRPDLGVTDWFVEDLVDQGDPVVERMLASPSWAASLDGDLRVAPAHGRAPGEYLSKLGRAYMGKYQQRWTVRLQRLLTRLETRVHPTVVLLKSRSGFHDIAAATVTDLDAEVLLFAVDSAGTWSGYEVLFRHWRRQALAATIRERLSIVSALTPELETERYLEAFRERSWRLFRDGLYGAAEPAGNEADASSFDLHEEDAPHDPLTVRWHRGFAAGASLRDLDTTRVHQAYGDFLPRFDALCAARRGRRP